MKINIDTNESVNSLTMTQTAQKLKSLKNVETALHEYKIKLISQFERAAKEKSGIDFKCNLSKTDLPLIGKEHWIAGDCVECTKSNSRYFTVGCEYKVVSGSSSDDGLVLIDDEGDEYGDPDAEFTLARRA